MQFKYKNKTINYEESGSGPTMLFVHGWGGNMDSLKGLFDEFSNKYRCVRIDLPGFGKSSNPDSSWGVEEYAECVKSFIGDEQVIYCGHSFGGAIGIYLAAKYKNISKLILFAPSYHRKNNGTKVRAISFPGYHQVKMVLSPFRKVAYRILYPKSQALKYPHLESNFRKIVTEDLSPLLKDIDVRTLILWGDADSFVDISDAYLLNEGIKGSQLKVYNDVNHDLPFKMVDDVSKDIKLFLEGK